MIYGSVCSGIEAASVAWHPLGWRAAFLSEIEAFPRAVLAHHYPGVPLHGDFTTIRAGEYAAIDVLVGGTPCQSFSVAGLRGGLADDRGNLAIEYLRLAQRLRPKWLVWENVPGVLSSAGGRDFGSILGGLGELGYGFAYRVLDAQYVRTHGFLRAVPQRRRRVFVVGHLGDWRRAAAVLFERASLQGDTPPRREAGKGAAPTLAARTKGGGGLGTDFDCDRGLIPALRADGFDASEDGTGRGTPLIPAYSICMGSDPIWGRECAMPQTQRNGDPGVVALGWRVRRLTPTECERLQGFPDGYTAIPHRGKPASNGPRYKALGNSMAVNCMRWIGQRIQSVENACASIRKD